MQRFGALFLTLLCAAQPGFSRRDTAQCGTHRDQPAESLFLHRQSVRASAGKRVARAASPAPASRDIGNIAVIDDSDGAVSRLNQFNLGARSVRFTPSAGAGSYRYAVVDGGYDDTAASKGSAVPLNDDDAALVDLPFSFPFYGTEYRQVWINSDGNLTFNAGDTATTDRSLGRMTSGEPRISPLFADLDPSRAGVVRTAAGGDSFLITWRGVPEYRDAGTGPLQTFQAALYADGRIEFSYSAVSIGNAVVGIAPGRLRGATSVVSFRLDPSGEYFGAVVERFADEQQIDIVAVAQKFYQTHEDSYDYLAIFNNMNISAGGSAVAFESTVRNSRTGYGDALGDSGRDYGSASRLQAVMNFGQLSQYPRDVAAVVPTRRAAGDTPLSIMGHEAGHLFLAFASARPGNDPLARPMLGAQNAHWSFLFNSEASLLEGERIQDRGPSISPRFITTDTVQGFSALDQYLMGLRPASEVPPTFYVSDPPAFMAQQHPQRGATFDGTRVDVTVEDVIAAEGRRTPDHTVAQRRFRFAFILVAAAGSTPSAADLDQIETYRREFEPYFARVSENRAFADTTLRRSLKLSMYPAAGVIAAAAAPASLTIETPAATPLVVELQAGGGVATVPPTVTIPAGARSAAFEVRGARAGVEEITAVPRDGAFETAFARVQVSQPADVRIEAVSGDRQIGAPGTPLGQPVVVRVTDVNRLPYPGVVVRAAISGGSVAAAETTTDESGQASFRWTLGPGAVNELRIGSDSGLSPLTVRAGSGATVVASALNGASYASGLAPGAFGTLTGFNLTGGSTARAGEPWPENLGGVRILLGGRPLNLLFTSDRQINFYVPPDVPPGEQAVTVETRGTVSAALPVSVHPVMPGIFFDAATGYGAVLKAGTGETTAAQPVRSGDVVEIYCTGLGPTVSSTGYRQTVYTPVVSIGGVPSLVLFSGLTAIPGLYQVNAQAPFGVAPGTQTLTVRIGSETVSNEVKIELR